MSQALVSDIVYLKGVQCPSVVGVFEWEKHIQQTLVLDIELATDTRKAAVKDDLNDALDYQAVAELAQNFCAHNQFQLIETLIERLAEQILTEFDTKMVRITMDKGQAVTGVNHVGLIIERHRR